MDLDSITAICQWIGAILGIAGAWGVGGQSPRVRFWGFTGFAVSNLVLIVAFWIMGSSPLLGMQAIFLATSIRGMLSNHAAGNKSGVKYPEGI